MSGILDARSRVIDTVITDQGKIALSSGNFNISFASFQDSTNYQADAQSGSSDASNRPFLEPCSLPSDLISFGVDDSGRLSFFNSVSGISVVGGKILASTKKKTLEVITGSLTGSKFVVSGTKLLDEGSIQAFRKMMSISTKYPNEDSEEFSISQNEISFDITNDNPLVQNAIKTTTLESAESLFQDRRLSHINNFAYLPPVNKTTKTPLGFYPPLGTITRLTPEAIEREIAEAESKGQSFDVEFINTSRNNNIFAQFFEVNSNDLVKLDVIDYGSYPDEGSEFSTKRVLFAGKLMLDAFNNHTYIHMFTLVFFDK